MKRKLASFLIPLLILTALLATNNPAVPKVHAASVGLVCLADPGFFPPGSSSTGNACPTPPVIFTGPNSPNNQLKIAVNINASDIYLGFDITLRADHTILKPADADLTGSVLASSSMDLKCIGNVPKVSTCTSTDTPDTIHFRASQSTTITTNGLLFTAVFNVTNTMTGGINIAFQRGCPTPTSVPPVVCITLINGSLTPTAENAQEASFSNQPGFAISAAPTNLLLKRGASIPTTITVTSVLGFNGTVALATQISPTGIGATLTLPSLKVSKTSPDNSTTLTTSAANSTTLILYSINVTGTASSTVLFTIISVNVVYFTMSSASPASLTISVGKNDSSTVKLTGLNGYVGTIPITTATNATTGLVVTCTPASITLDPSKGLPSTSKCTFIPSSAGGYNTTITASDGTISHSTFVIIKALPSGAKDYAINALPSIFFVPLGGSTQTVLIVTSISGLSGTVNLAATTTAKGLTLSPTFLSLQLSPDGANFTILTITVATSALIGPYKVNITSTLTSASQQKTHIIQLTPIATSDFSISTSSPVLTMSVGGSARSNITLTNLGNLGSNVALTVKSSPTGLTGSFNTTTVTLKDVSRKVAILTINAPNGTSPGVYTITIFGKSGSITHNTTLTVNLVLHDVRIIYVNVSTSTATQGSRVTYNIVVQNRGTVSENVTVDALVGGLTVNATSLILQPGEAKAVALTWNTSSFTAGTYALGAKVLKVPGQYNTANNIDMAATTFNLTAPPTSPLSQSIILILAIAAAAVVAVIIGLALLRRRTSAKTAL